MLDGQSVHFRYSIQDLHCNGFSTARQPNLRSLRRIPRPCRRLYRSLRVSPRSRPRDGLVTSANFPSPLCRPFLDPSHSQEPSAGSTSTIPKVAPDSPARKDTSALATSSQITSTSSTSGGSKKRKGKKPLPHSKVKLGTGATIAQWTINE